MSSLSNLSPRELEWLSAYADGELPPQEAAGLRARLEQDPGLRLALAEIQQTAGLLRSLPALKPPRAFTLSAERAAVARRYPRLQFATALAGLAFFLVVGADVFARTGMAAPRLLAAGQQVAVPAAEPAMDQVLEKEQPLPEVGLQPAPLEAAGTAAPAQGEARAAELAATSSPVGESTAAEELAAAPPQTATAPSYADTGQAAAGTQPAEATPEAEALALESQTEATPEAEALALELQAQAETPESVSGDDQVAAQAQEGDRLAAPEPTQVPGAASSPGQLSEAAPFRSLNRSAGAGLAFQLAEIGLGGAALVLAVLTLRTRRRR
jgi:anti-sigma factor RsiW